MKRILSIFVLAAALAATAAAQNFASANAVSFTDASGNRIYAGDNANNALRVNVVAGAGGGTASSFGAAFPATGTAAGFSDGTNMQGARVFDLDTGGGTIYALGVNLRRSASGAATELIGQQAMADSLPVVIASDQGAFTVNVGTFPDNEPFNVAQVAGNAVNTGNGTVGTGTLRVTIASDSTGSVAATQSGAWTVQPGNTANTTPWFVKTVPLHGCSGNTLQDVTQVDVATGAGSDLTTADTCVFNLWIANKTNSAVTVRVEDGQGTPVVYLGGNADFSIGPNSAINLPYDGMKFTGGVTLVAGTATALNARLRGVQ